MLVRLRELWLCPLLLVTGSACFLACASNLAEGRQGTLVNKPTRAEIQASIAEIQKLSFDEEINEALARLKKLGPLPRIQETLGDIYHGANHKDKVTILRMLDRIGVEYAVGAFPAIAADFAVARSKHPNDMSFASFYVLEKFMRLAWKCLPSDKDMEKKADKAKVLEEPKQGMPDNYKPTKVSLDAFTHSGSVNDRKAIAALITAKKLNISDHEGKPAKHYPVPGADDADWVRVIGNHAFARLRGQSSGVDYLFVKSKQGQWELLATLMKWVN